MKLRGELVAASDITPVRLEQMYRLMDRHYQFVTREKVAVDLAEKDWVILLLDPATDELCGFSTQMLLSLDTPAGIVRVLFSGDTIVAIERWGDIALSHAWGQLALSLIAKVAPQKLFWLLISKGYKTYRFLPLFFREYFPRYDAPTPLWAQEIITAFGRYKYPTCFDEAAGIVRSNDRKDRLRTGIADLTEARLADPHIRCFAERNPGHARGDELCCVAPITRENFTAAAYRVIEARSIDPGIADANRPSA